MQRRNQAKDEGFERSLMNVVARFLKRSLMPIAIILIAVAALSSVFRALTPMMGQYKPQVESFLTSFVGKPVTIQELETGWYWFEPAVKANRVIVHASDKTSLKIKQIQVGLDLWGSLIHWRIQPGWLLVDGLRLEIKQTSEGWQINDLTLQPSQQAPQDVSIGRMLSVVLGHQRLQVQHINCNLLLKDGRNVRLKDLSATLVNTLGKHRLKGETILLDKHPAKTYFGAELILSPFQLEKTSGHIYFKTEELQLKPWASFFSIPQLRQGEGQIEVWGDIEQAHVQALQGSLKLTHLIWQDKNLEQPLQVNALSANLAWIKNPTGFQLSGSSVQVVMPESTWPETSFNLKVDSLKSFYDLYVKRLELHKVLMLPLHFPDEMQTLKRFQVRGLLEDLHISQGEKGIGLLTQFTHLSWKKNAYAPGVSHLSGVIDADKEHGHLALDSESVKLQFQQLPSLTFPRVNLELKWEKQIKGLQFKLDRIILDHPHLSLKAKGVLSEVRTEDWGNIDLKAGFTAKDAQFWLPYLLPKANLKPGLYLWLSKGIHKIGEATGQVILQGALRDFPFDHQNGKFSIVTSLKGTDLDFAPHWPMARDIVGKLSLDHRLLEADISQGKIGQAQISAVNLQVNDLGLDKERLWVHGVAQSDAKHAWEVLLASPLGKTYPLFSSMHWSGPLSLDLQLDVPLYPEKKGLLIRGQVAFVKDTLTLKVANGALPFEKLTGKLEFDEHGLLNSQLASFLWDEPFPLTILSLRKAQPSTVLRTQGQVNVEDVLHAFHMEKSDLIQGNAFLTATLSLPAGTAAINTLTLQSNLKGVKVNLGTLFQKPVETIQPFESVIKFYPSSRFSMAIHYDKEIEANRSQEGVWSLDARKLFGGSHLQYHPNENKLAGKIETFRLSESEQFKSDKWSIKPGDLPGLDLTIEHVALDSFDLGQVILHAKPGVDTWTVDPFEIHTPEYAVQGQATWKQQAGKQTSRLVFDLVTPDVSHTLIRLKESPVLEAGKGKMHVDVTWKDSLWRGALGMMQGDVDFSIKHGRTKNLSRETESKIGLGKLLSILSLQTIPRRLMLDFSDLSNQGYSFDEFTGKFTLERGVLQTQSCSIDGPVAYAAIQGRIDLVRKLYDLNIRISPHITASLPIVATIAGGPIAGVATWVASKVINQGVQKIISYTYRVSGPWQDPVIEQVRFYKAR